MASLVLGIVGTTGFVVTFLVDGATRPGYQPRRHAVSALALGDRGWVQTANFVVGGGLVTASSPGIHAATDTVWLPAVVAVFGLALVASGLFPMEPMRGYPPGAAEGKPESTSRVHRLHDAAGTIVFGSLPVATVLAALSLEEPGWVWYSGVTAVALAVLTWAFGAAWERDSPWTGLVQRAAILCGWSWLGLLCSHLMRRST